jgi:CheY-like chemotaxis protein
MYRVMIVDDEENVLRALRRLLRSAPCYHQGVAYELDVETYTSPLDALEKMAESPYALILADYRMPEMDGAEFLRRARELQPDTVRMVLSGYADLNGLMKAINEAGITRFIAKPWNDYELICAIAQGLAYRDMLLENVRLANTCRLEHGDVIPDAGRVEPPVAAGEGERRATTWAADGSAIYDDTSHWYG